MVLITIVNGIYKSIYDYGYESIPINTMFSGMNIHFNPAILMWTEGVLLVLTHCQLSTTWYNKKSILRELGCTWWTGVLACNLRILMTNIYIYICTGWWFGTCFMFPFSWDFLDPNCYSLIFFRGVGQPPTRYECYLGQDWKRLLEVTGFVSHDGSGWCR